MQRQFSDRPVPFATFMEYCLYDPEAGYYRRGKPVFGPSGDYFTSPYTHPIFSEILAESVARCFFQLGRPVPFHLVELGAGEGVLGRDLLANLKRKAPEVFECAEYHPLEVERGHLPASIRGVVFSNEFFDALPVHRVRVHGSTLSEIYVLFENGEWREVEGELSDHRILDYMKKGFAGWRDGWVYEVNLRMVEMLEELDRRVDCGFVVTFDYGFDRDSYHDVERPEGTLLGYHRHQARSDPYTLIGKQDLTTHVNFSMMKEAGKEFGWVNHPLVSQREFLMERGLEEKLLEEEKGGLLQNDRLRERLGLKALLIPGGISDTMRVLVQAVRTGGVA